MASPKCKSQHLEAALNHGTAIAIVVSAAAVVTAVIAAAFVPVDLPVRVSLSQRRRFKPIQRRRHQLRAQENRLQDRSVIILTPTDYLFFNLSILPLVFGFLAPPAFTQLRTIPENVILSPEDLLQRGEGEDSAVARLAHPPSDRERERRRPGPPPPPEESHRQFLAAVCQDGGLPDP